MSSNRTAQAYIVAVIVLGAALVAASLTHWESEPRRFIWFAVLALLSSTLKVRLPGIAGTFSANSAFTLIAISQLSFAEAVLLSVACAIVQCLWRAAKAPTLIQVLFNAAVFAIGSATTFYFYHLCLRSTKGDAWVGSFVMASCVFFLLNTFAISAVIGVVENKSFLRVWRVWHLWSFPYYVVSIALAGVLTSSASEAAWKLAVAAATMMCASFLCYRLVVRKFSEAPF